MRGAQSLKYFFQYRLRIQQYIVIPESDYSIAALHQVFRTLPIVFFRRLMLTPVEFHDQASFCADKINNVWRYRKLTAEFKAY